MAEVYETATFYAHFDVLAEGEAPPPAITVRVCDSLSCELAGAKGLLESLPTALGENVRVVRAPCMGRCDTAPVAEVGHRHVDHVDAQAIRAVIEAGDLHPVIPEYRALDAYEQDGGYAPPARLPRGRAHVRGHRREARHRRPARPRRRRVPDRAEVAHRARLRRSSADGGQRGRGRARDVQGSLLSGARPASVPRRRPRRGVGGGGGRRLDLPPGRVPVHPRDPAPRDGEDRPGRARRPHGAAPAPRGRRLHLRRGVLDDRVHRGQAGTAAPPPALRRRGRGVRAPDAGAERGDHVLGPRHRREGAGVVREPRPQRRQGPCAAIRCPGG